MTHEMGEHLQRAYAEERFTMTVGEIQRRARVTRRRRLSLGTVAAAFAVVVSAGGVTAATVGVTAMTVGRVAGPDEPYRGDPDPDVYCAKSEGMPAGSGVSADDQATILFDLRERNRALRMLRTRDGVLVICQLHHGADDAVSASFGPVKAQPELFEQQLQDAPEAGVPYFVEFGNGLGAGYVFGVLPEGADGARVKPADGRELTAAVSGRYFLAWSPRDGLKDASVRAVAGDDLVADGYLASLKLVSFDVSYLDQLCRAEISSPGPGRDDSTGDDSDPPVEDNQATPVGGLSLIYSQDRDIDNQGGLLLYADESRLVACRLTPAGTIEADFSYEASGPSWPTFGGAFGVRYGYGFLFIKPPAGSTYAEVTLASGNTTTTRLIDGFGIAVWNAPGDDELPVKIRFETPEGWKTHEFN